MKQKRLWVMTATLLIICGATMLTSCSSRVATGGTASLKQGNDNALPAGIGITPSQSRVGYSAWCTQVSYTHCEPLPKTGKPEMVSGTWEMNDGILQHKAGEKAPLAICNYVIPSDHYTIECRARKDGGPEGFVIVFNYMDQQHYCQLNFGTNGNTLHTIEQISGDSRTKTVTRPGSVETGRWYDVRLIVSGDSVKAWLDDMPVFDDVLRLIKKTY